MSDFMREDAVDDFLNAEAINYQLRKAGNDVIADDGSDIDRITGDDLPGYIPARKTHLVQPTDVELHAYDHDEPECWPYDCSEMPCDSEECDDEYDEDECEEDDGFDVEDLFSDELEALDDLETDVEEVEDEVIEDDDYDEEVDDEDYY